MGDKAKNSKLDIPTDDDPSEYSSLAAGIARRPAARLYACPPPSTDTTFVLHHVNNPRPRCYKADAVSSLSDLTTARTTTLTRPSGPLLHPLHLATEILDILARCCDCDLDPARIRDYTAATQPCAITCALPLQLCTPRIAASPFPHITLSAMSTMTLNPVDPLASQAFVDDSGAPATLPDVGDGGEQSKLKVLMGLLKK